MRANNVSWGEMTKKAKDRQALVIALFAQEQEEDWVIEWVIEWVFERVIEWVSDWVID